MVQSIELLFDEPAETALRSAWDGLAAAGLPSLAQHQGPTNRPHVTVAVAESGLDPAVAAVRAIADHGLDGLGPLEVGAPLLFGGHRHRWVLTRQIVPSGRLLAFHATVHGAIRDAAPDAEVVVQTLPDRWTPHASLVRHISADRVAEALEAIDPTPLTCRFVGLRLWDSVERTVQSLSTRSPGTPS